VHKFGGASLADGAAMRHAVEIIGTLLDRPTVIVVSAMAGVTDRLLALATAAAHGLTPDARALVHLRKQHLDALRHVVPAGPARRRTEALVRDSLSELAALLGGLQVVRELTPRMSDHVVARGEQLSAAILAAALRARRRKVQLMDALDLIATDGHFGGASPDYAATERRVRATLGPLLRRGVTPVVPGFLGAGPGGELVTLGRGGSDLTATLLGRSLRAESVSLWKDVPGFLTGDPRVVANTRVIPHLHAREAAELAYYGAKVLHPRALVPLARRKVPVFVRPFGDASMQGTEVSERRSRERSPVRAVSGIGEQALVTVTGTGLLGVPGVASRTFETLHAARLPVTLVTQGSSEHSLTFSVPATAATTVDAALRKEFRDELARRDVEGIEVRRGMATVAVVGLGMAGARGVAARVFGAMAHAGINIIAIAQGSSELNISFVIEEADVAEAQRRIHQAFQLEKIGGGAVNAPERVAVVLLGFGKVGRMLARQVPKASRSAIRLEVAAVIDRTGFVFDPEGLSSRRVNELADRKARGLPLKRARGGVASSSTDALAFIARHALPRPVVVDVTANDTAAILRHVLDSGMDVVLANKRPLTERLHDADQLEAVALRHGRHLMFEATVGAGLPIIDTLFKLQESGDRIRRIEGCLSGTLGFLLSELGDGRPFSATVQEAMRRGYTEPDPREDLSGMDVARKALILGRLLGFAWGIEDVEVESLVPRQARDLALEDFLDTLARYDAPWDARVRAARARGTLLRYVARVTSRRITVGLTSVPVASALGALRGTDNQVVFTTERYHTNPLVITGPGAGLEVTAAGVMNDIMRLAPI
jgi:aspartokinase/homoserine dehydrogenase 1